MLQRTQCGTHSVGSDLTAHTDVVKCGALWCSIGGWGVVLHGMVQSGTVWCRVVQYSGEWCNTVECCKVGWCVMVQCSVLGYSLLVLGVGVKVALT